MGELYGFGNWSGRDVDGSFFYRNPNTRTGVFADGAGSALVADLTPMATPLRTRGGDGRPGRPQRLGTCHGRPELPSSTASGSPAAFTPRFGGEVGDAALTAGWRGVRANGLRYDFSVSAGRNEAVYRIRNTVNASYGPNTPTAFDLGAQIQFERLVNADFALPVDVGAYSDLNVAFGAQHHKEVFEMVAGDTESWAPGRVRRPGVLGGLQRLPRLQRRCGRAVWAATATPAGWT